MDPIDLGDIDLRTLRTAVIDEDGDLILTVGDGDARVSFTAGFGNHARAILGAERLASAAREYAETLRAEVMSAIADTGLAQQGKGQRGERDEHSDAR